MFLIINETLVLLLTRHLHGLKIPGKKLYGGLQCTMRMTRGKNDEKIGTFLLNSYDFLYSNIIA